MDENNYPLDSQLSQSKKWTVDDAVNDVSKLLFNIGRGVSMSRIHDNSNIDHFQVPVHKAFFLFFYLFFNLIL